MKSLVRWWWLVVLAASPGPGCSSEGGGQQIVGTWKGRLDLPGGDLAMQLMLPDAPGGVATVGTPDAGGEFTTTNVTREAGALELVVEGQFTLEGQFSADESELAGVWLRQEKRMPFRLQQGDSPLQWTGNLTIPASKPAVNFRVREAEGLLKAIWDSPDQGFSRSPVDTISFGGEDIRIVMENGRFTYTGKLQADGNTLQGELQERGKPQGFPLVLRRIRDVHAGGEYTYQRPASVGDGWETSTLTAEGVDPGRIQDLMTRIVKDNEFGALHSLLVVRNGKLILEEYFKGYDRDDKHDIKGASECLGALLMGIAVDRKVVSGMEAPIYDYFTDLEPHANWDDAKRSIQLQHLMSMSTGLECNDWNPSSLGGEGELLLSPDWVKFFLDLPVAGQPGQAFLYCRAGTMLAGAILQQASGKKLTDFANEALFQPLGITDFRWDYSPKGRAFLGGRFFMKPRDLAKLGQVYVSGGQWLGQQILSRQWVQESAQKRFSNQLTDGYGYFWFTERFFVGQQEVAAISANGAGGQKLLVVPAFQLVVVFTGGLPGSGLSEPAQILNQHLLPALR